MIVLRVKRRKSPTMYIQLKFWKSSLKKKKKKKLIIAESLIQFIPKYTLYVENYIESKISIIGKYKPTFQCFT